MKLRFVPERDCDRLTGVMAAVYAIALVAFGVSDALALLFTEALVAGPIVLAYLLSARLVRVQARMILFWFAAAYTILSAIIFFETFATEQDAGYQLQLLAIPMIGIPSLAFVTLAAIGANRR